jgi:hypothetical protein
LYFIAFPTAALVVGYGAHENGHMARAVEEGWTQIDIDIQKWPWPTPFIRASGYGVAPNVATPYRPLYDVASGEEGSRRLAESLLERLFAREDSNYFDWVLLGYAKLEYSAYALYDLTPSTIRSPDALFSDGYDFRSYAIEFTQLKGVGADGLQYRDFQNSARRLRRDAFLNMADLTLASALVRTWRYIRHGETIGRAPALSWQGVTVTGGAFASLAAEGPERGLNALAVTQRLLVRSQISHIDAYGADDLWAWALSSRWRSEHGLAPRLSLEMRQAQTPFEWGPDDRRAHKDGETIRIGLGASGVFLPRSRPVNWDIDVSYKTRGYLPGTPTRAGASASGALEVTF